MRGERAETIDATEPEATRSGSISPSQASGRGRRSWLWLWLSLAVSGALLALGATVVARSFGSLPVALRYVRGERFFLEPAWLRVGPLEVGKPITAYAEIRNHTSGPVRLLGADHRCICAVAKGLPATVPAGAIFRLPIAVQALADKPMVDESIVIFTDSKDRPELVVHVLGTARR
jgi:hypothetical protein